MLLDPNLEPPLPAVKPRVESAPIEVLSQQSVSPAVSQRYIKGGPSKHDELEPPPPLEFEPTIEPAEFNQLFDDVVGNPNIPIKTSSKETVPKVLTPSEKEVPRSKPVSTDTIHWTELSYDLGLQGFAQAIAIT